MDSLMYVFADSNSFMFVWGFVTMLRQSMLSHFRMLFYRLHYFLGILMLYLQRIMVRKWN